MDLLIAIGVVAAWNPNDSKNSSTVPSTGGYHSDILPPFSSCTIRCADVIIIAVGCDSKECAKPRSLFKLGSEYLGDVIENTLPTFYQSMNSFPPVMIFISRAAVRFYRISIEIGSDMFNEPSEDWQIAKYSSIDPGLKS